MELNFIRYFKSRHGSLSLHAFNIASNICSTNVYKLTYFYFKWKGRNTCKIVIISKALVGINIVSLSKFPFFITHLANFRFRFRNFAIISSFFLFSTVFFSPQPIFSPSPFQQPQSSPASSSPPNHSAT